MSSATQVIFDAPGPKAKRLNVVISAIALLLMVLLGFFVWWKFESAGQFAPEKWTPFTYSVIQSVLLEGTIATLKVAVVASLLALPLGVVFALLRMSTRKWLSVPATVLLEIFRGVPVLLLIFAIFFLGQVSSFWAVSLGLMLYNGMVLAEIIRAGLQAVPAGQKEAASAIGLRHAQVLRLVLMPQAIRIMMPSVVAQLVVILKDSALGYLVTYRDLLREVNAIGTSYNNLLPTFIVGAAIYVIINLVVAGAARYLEQRMRRSPKTKTN